MVLANVKISGHDFVYILSDLPTYTCTCTLHVHVPYIYMCGEYNESNLLANFHEIIEFLTTAFVKNI